MPGVLGTICCDSQSSLAFLRIRQRVVLICELINYLGLKLVYVQMTRKTPILFRGTVTLVSLTLRLLPVVLLMAAAGGWFGHVDPATGMFERVTFCPGYTRGLAFHGDFALCLCR